MLKGIDIAYPYQPDPLSMAKVKAEGAAFVVQKVTQGVYFNYNPEAQARIKQVKDAGLVAGAYHFLTRVEDPTGLAYPWNSGTAQCNAYAAALPGGSPEGLICMVNWENNDGQPFKHDGVQYTPFARGGSWFELRDFVRRWFVLFPSHPLFLYTRGSYAGPRAEGNDVKALNPRLYLWDANYVSGSTPVRGRDIDDAQIAAFEADVANLGRPAWTRSYVGFSGSVIWQYGGFGITDYHGGAKVDGDLFRGTVANLESYASSAGIPSVTPLEVGTVESLADERLRASITIPAAAHLATDYDIQLSPRPAAGSPDWLHPVWMVHGVPVKGDVIEDDDEAAVAPSPTDPVPPDFETLAGCPAVDGMKVDDDRPAVRLSVQEPIDRFRWRLCQDDFVVERQDHVTEGVTDGTCIEFQPTFVLRRGKPGHADPVNEGEFEPPFTGGITYDSRTYHGHSNFAVDFNRKDHQDNGEWVYACSPGRVQSVHRGSVRTLPNDDPSEVYIGHKGRYQTLYVHMDHIQVRRGERVARGQKLGRVSDVGAPLGPHLHLQMRQRASAATSIFGGTPIKMRLSGVAMTASIGDSDTRPESWPVHFGEDVTGIAQPAAQVAPELRVSVRRASDGAWSRYRRLGFVVSKNGNEVAPCPATGCGTSEAPGGLSISQVYDGPSLAPGDYSLRYRIIDDLGDVSAWAYDDSVVVTGGDDEAF